MALSSPRDLGHTPGPACPVLTFWVDGVDTAIPMPDPGRTERTLYWKTGACHHHRPLRGQGHATLPTPRAFSVESAGDRTQRPGLASRRGQRLAGSPSWHRTRLSLLRGTTRGNGLENVRVGTAICAPTRGGLRDEGRQHRVRGARDLTAWACLPVLSLPSE